MVAPYLNVYNSHLTLAEAAKRARENVTLVRSSPSVRSLVQKRRGRAKLSLGSIVWGSLYLDAREGQSYGRCGGESYTECDLGIATRV